MRKLKQHTIKLFLILFAFVLSAEIDARAIGLGYLNYSTSHVPFCNSSLFQESSVVHFKPKSYIFKPFEYKLDFTQDLYLKKLSKYLLQNKNTHVRLFSYCSDSRKIDINNQLSNLRYFTLISRLKQYDIDENRIKFYNLASTTDLFNMKSCILLKIY